MAIKIQYLADPALVKPIQHGDWVDLRAAQSMFLPAKKMTMIPLGVAMKLPEGYEAIVAPRSSTFKNYGIIMTNSIGVIDENYCGPNDEWHFPAYVLEPKTIENGKLGTRINAGDRICQFRIQKCQGTLAFEVVDRLEDPDRGGFGSTGVN